MRPLFLQRLAGGALILGALLLATYATAFPLLLPLDKMETDFPQLVLSPHWLWLAGVALAGVLLLAAGFAGVYSRLYASAGWTGLFGFVFLELAYLLQAMSVSWEVFLFPVIARHTGSVALLRDKLIIQDGLVHAFELAAAATILVGTVLFCLALVRSRAFPRYAGVVVFVGALLYGLNLNFTAAVAGILIHTLGCLILALRLFRPAEPVGDCA
jgi:hypothetical protein